MKNHILAVALLICASSMHCGQIGASGTSQEPWQKNGSVRVVIQQNNLPSGVRIIEARLERPGLRPLTQSREIQRGAEAQSLRFDQVPVGSWSLSVQALNRSGVILYRGESTVSVVGSQIAEASVLMRRVTSGSVEVSLLWGKNTVKWQMHPGNPVLMQTPDSWDSDHYYVHDPVVLKVNGVYHMWYSSGINGSVSGNGEDTFWIAYATSPDGINWTKYGTVVNPGPPGSWMDMGPDSPSVIYDGGIFKMWFSGAKHPRMYMNGIGYATSTDGKTWDVDPRPVVSSSIGRTWNPTVVKKGDLYYLYTGVTSSMTEYSYDIVLLTSADGRNWLNRGKVLAARQEVSWESAGISPCEVIYDENRFKMFYTGFVGHTCSIGYAESVEGLNWFNTSDLPTLDISDTSPWTLSAVGTPAVIRDDGKLKMWFSGLTDRSHGYHIGYAEQTK
ncbi:MAG: hypothetical protein NTZ35_00465 [Ignavibacteriales bacterium]|nr:hypothetical protein [Ignavibacteriales bacterium]